MRDKKKKGWILGLVIAVIIVLAPMTYQSMNNGHDVEKVRAKIENYLYDKYGEEFVVDRIGSRQFRGKEEYVARIYPKSIIGTTKEGDKYYYGSASVDKLAFGRLDEPGDSYSYIIMNETGEKYLEPKAKEIFGDRILLKVDSELEIWGKEDIIIKEYKKNDKYSKGVDAFIGYKESDFKKARERVVNNPKHNKLKLNLYVYIFDRIDNEKEKEKRRKEIFDFVQYLKQEGLFRYLEMGVIFIDERVLAPSYREFRREVFLSDKIKEKIDGESVYLPPMTLRKKMSKVLQEEVNQMSEEELLASMRKIRKSELSYKGINQYNSQYISEVYSIGKIKNRYSSWLDKGYIPKKYKNIKDINIEGILDYIYLK
jgi:hypothetical protein